MSFHIPIQPAWTCARCATPWPCLDRREELRAEYAGAPVSLSVYMATCLLDAMIDLADDRSGYLYWRFMGWWH